MSHPVKYFICYWNIPFHMLLEDTLSYIIYGFFLENIVPYILKNTE